MSGPPIPEVVGHAIGTVKTCGIGDPPIELSQGLTPYSTLSSRNTKKPTKAKWFLGEDYPTAVDIESRGCRPRMTWRMSDKIKCWEITWRDSTPSNPVVSLGINGDLESAIMMSHGMTLLTLTSTANERWANALVALLTAHPIWPGKREDDYIAVVLDTKYCHMELCARAQDKGL